MRAHMLTEAQYQAAKAAALARILAARAAYDATPDGEDVPQHVWALAHCATIPGFDAPPAWEGSDDAPLLLEGVTDVEWRGPRSGEHPDGLALGWAHLSDDEPVEIPAGVASCRLQFGHGMHIVCIGDAFAQVCGWALLPVDLRGDLRLAAVAITPTLLTGDDGRELVAGRYVRSSPGRRPAGQVVRRSEAYGHYPNGAPWTDHVSLVFQPAT